MTNHLDIDPLKLFGMYMKLVDVPRLEAEEAIDPALEGKKLGIVNGGAWIQLWSYYFGRRFLPGVKLINIGNEAVQLNFMRAHHEKRPCPPPSNIELFGAYARQLKELADVDAVIVTCSTMNRSFDTVREAVRNYDIPVVQIDEPMMEKAVSREGRILVVATHGPTVTSTTELLKETSQRYRDSEVNESQSLSYTGATVEEAFDALGKGEIERHNEIIANAIREAMRKEKIDRVVLAQLSMSVFKFSYPDPEKSFGIPVLTSGEEGFRRIAQILGKTNTIK